MTIAQQSNKKGERNHTCALNSVLTDVLTLFMNDNWSIPPADFLSSLSTQDKQTLLAAGEKISFKKNEIIFQAGAADEYVYLLLDGRTKIYQLSPSGKEVIMWFCFENEIFGLAEVYRGTKRAVYARACCDTQVSRIHYRDFKQFLAGNTEAAILIIDLLSSRLRVLGDTLLNISSGDVISRILKLLTRLSARYGKQNGDNICLDIPLTHQEIADMISASRQTVSSVLSELKKEGVLRTHNRRILIQAPKLYEYLDKT